MFPMFHHHVSKVFPVCSHDFPWCCWARSPKLSHDYPMIIPFLSILKPYETILKPYIYTSLFHHGSRDFPKVFFLTVSQELVRFSQEYRGFGEVLQRLPGLMCRARSVTWPSSGSPGDVEKIWGKSEKHHL